ncbi:MAG TPA: MTH938/NDUFAF3 family protein [Hyphomicrobiales bacterium]|nr:MTH938/NDUFAF3 family protein [Hyphomicrobiales bacterium]
MSLAEGHFPGRAPLDAYGGGGFRFAEMSHHGSILCLPSGIWAWPVADAAAIDVAALAKVIAEAEAIELLLLGTGPALVPPRPEVRAALAGAGVRAETMSTGAAARTYNVLLAEDRKVAAALVAVE